MSIEYRVGLGRKNMEKWEKTHHLWTFSRGGTGTISVLSTGTSTEKSVSVPNILFWTSVSILAITWSFRIRIE